MYTVSTKATNEFHMSIRTAAATENCQQLHLLNDIPLCCCCVAQFLTAAQGLGRVGHSTAAGDCVSLAGKCGTLASVLEC